MLDSLSGGSRVERERRAAGLALSPADADGSSAIQRREMKPKPVEDVQPAMQPHANLYRLRLSNMFLVPPQTIESSIINGI